MKKKGFTLVELLAVIVILAIIALIATPMILNVIENAKKGASKSSALGYIDAIEKSILEEELKGNIIDKNKVYDVSDLTFINIKGDKPTEGWVQLEKGIVKDYSLRIGNYIVNNEDGQAKAEKGDTVEETPDGSDSEGKTEVAICTATSGTISYTVGTEYTCDPGDGITRTFYILEDGDNTTLVKGDTGTAGIGEVSLIMNNNIGDTVAWSEDGTTKNGPVTALAYLKSQTNNWENVSVSLPSANQIAKAGGDDTWNYNYTGNILSSWLISNLDKGYWTSTVRSEVGAYNVHAEQDIRYNAVNLTEIFGVRPVIIISKDKLS